MAIASTLAPVNHYLILFLKQNDRREEYFVKAVLASERNMSAGNIIVEGDFKALMRLGTEPSIQDMKLSSENKINLIG